MHPCRTPLFIMKSLDDHAAGIGFFNESIEPAHRLLPLRRVSQRSLRGEAGQIERDSGEKEEYDGQ